MRTAPPIPAELWALMDRVGPKWGSNVPGHVRLMVEAFTPLLARCPKDGVKLTRGIAYGAHPRQILDVYQASGGRGAPMVLFAHGGAFVDGDKDRSPEIYGNVLYYLARHGIIGINVEYRLAPEIRYPAGSEDVGLAVRWAAQNAASLGGDAARLFAFGHSTGAAHAASYAYDVRRHPPGGPGLAGLIVVSGRVRADNLPENPNARKVEAYYGTDASVLNDVSPVSHVCAGSLPTMIAVAEFENPLIDVHCAELFYRFAAARRRASRFLRLARHNHTSIIAHLNTAEETLGREIVEFVETGR